MGNGIWDVYTMDSYSAVKRNENFRQNDIAGKYTEWGDSDLDMRMPHAFSCLFGDLGYESLGLNV